MDESAIVGRLRRAGVADFATPRRVAMLRSLSAIYENQRVLGPRAAPPLHDACDDSSECWKSLRAAARPTHAKAWGYARDRPGSIFWPWVGEHYAPGGVVLLTLNFRSGDDEATVALEYLAAWNARESLNRGEERDTRYHSFFGYRSLATAAAVRASLRDEKPNVKPKPRSLVPTMEQVARLQLVKCTPVDRVVERGSPSPEMCRNCPPRFLWKELGVLRPRVLVVFGVAAFNELDARPEVSWRCGTYLCRGTLTLGTKRVLLLWLHHPSSTNWPAGQRSLVRSLLREPLRDQT